ncbi:acyl carrier protein [Leptolyngbyaceae cyanobacterium CCMR0082]|uniref:Acyl carrier protein n=1 Tax=Adonisia turfae CCMR0082 TaxID=2304604 RepID=A0A6M0SCE1_9CYAN|nr:acyl carrier protein [Adonisia turfae]MDV3347335.1 acyl carrier protein [Leptothoe sp. LEGE 181152]NEZ65332.1 acyl carrier protein [Adonisia turfae CCMR0082]
MKEIKEKIYSFLSGHFSDYQLKEDEDIFATGFINSMFAMQLVLFIEKEFQLTIRDEELDFENFRTVNAMTRLIENKVSVTTSH